MEALRVQIVPGSQNPIDQLNSDIAALQEDMLKNPGNKNKDEQEIGLDQEQEAEEEKIRSWIAGDQSDHSVFRESETQIFNDEMLKEQINGGSGSSYESLESLKHEFLCRMIAMFREKDPNFAPLGTSEGAAALAKLGQIFDQLIADPSLLAQYIKDPSIVESLFN